jgi:hypothetical protein
MSPKRRMRDIEDYANGLDPRVRAEVTQTKRHLRVVLTCCGRTEVTTHSLSPSDGRSDMNMRSDIKRAVRLLTQEQPQ